MIAKQRPKKIYDMRQDELLDNPLITIVYYEDNIECLRNHRQKAGHLHSVFYDLRVYYERVPQNESISD